MASLKKNKLLSFGKTEGIKLYAIPWLVDDQPYENLSPEATECLKKGIDALKNNLPMPAMNHLTEGLAYDQNSAMLRFNLALVKLQAGDIKEAENDLINLIDDHPAYPFSYIQLAFLDMKSGNLDDAEEILSLADEIESFHHISFGNFCKANIFLNALKGHEFDTISIWFELWELYGEKDKNYRKILNTS